MLNYVILTTHSSYLYSMWKVTHMCNPTPMKLGFIKLKFQALWQSNQTLYLELEFGKLEFHWNLSLTNSSSKKHAT